MARRPGNRFIAGDKCSCVDYIPEDTIAKIVAGDLHFCQKCGSPIWFDTFSFIEEPEYMSIYYGTNNNKWALINTWKTKYFLNIIRNKYNDWSPSSQSFSRT